MQDVGGGVLIDDGFTLCPAGVGGDKGALNGRRRQSLVPQCDRQIGQLRKIAGESAGRLGAGSFRAVHVNWKSEDEAGRPPLGGKREYTLRIETKALARDRLDGRGNAPIRIAGGDADGFGAEIKTDENTAFRQERGGIREREDRHGMALSWTLVQRDSSRAAGGELSDPPARR